MREEKIPPEAQDLDAIFNHQPPAGHAIDPRDAALAKEVLSLAEKGLPVDAQFYHRLEQDLQSAAARRRRSFSGIWVPVLSSLLGGAVLIGLVLFSAPLLQRLLGRPEPAPTTKVVAGPTVIYQTLTPTVGATPAAQGTATMAATQPTGENGWTLKAALPQGPQQVPLYLQSVGGDPLTPQSAQQMAERLGVKGPVYQYPGEGGGTSLVVSDGKSSVLFFGATTLEFTFSSSYPAETEKSPLTFDQQAKIAEAWLASRGLVDFPHQIQPVLTDPARVQVIRKLESGSQYVQNPYDPPINVAVDPDGRVTQVLYRLLNPQIKDSLDLRPASEAWDALLSGALDKKLFYQTLDFSGQRSLKQWFPTYTPGEKIDVYGYASVIQSVDPAQPPLVDVGNLTVNGNAALLAQLQMRKFLHIWGLYQVDEQGHAWVEMQGWEISHLADIDRAGQLVQDGGGILLKADTGETYNVLNLPASVPLNVNLYVSGVRVSPSEIQWISIQTQVSGENNQTAGSLPLMDAPVVLEQPLPSTGYQPGDKVEGLQGTSQNSYVQEADGSKTIERMIMAEGWFARLQGKGAEGIETYQGLPVKVWGTYQVEGADIVIQVERWEPLWPGVKIEAYFGTFSEKVLEGKSVFVLNDDNGRQWVIQSSLNFPQSLANNGWDAATRLAVEGYPSPDQATYGGLPVLTDLSTAMLNIKGKTKENYQLYTNQIHPAERPAASTVLPKNVTVEQVELFYFSYDFRGSLPQEEEPRRLQPLWRFSGHLQDGRAFEVLVQAVKGQ